MSLSQERADDDSDDGTDELTGALDGTELVDDGSELVLDSAELVLDGAELLETIGQDEPPQGPLTQLGLQQSTGDPCLSQLPGCPGVGSQPTNGLLGAGP